MQENQSLAKIKLFEARQRQMASNTPVKILSIPREAENQVQIDGRDVTWVFQREHDIESNRC